MGGLAAQIGQIPPWVLPVVLIIVLRLLRAVRPRWISLVGLAIVPVLFVGIGVAQLVDRPPLHSIAWAFALFLTSPAGWRSAPRLLAVDRARHRIQVPGSIWSVLRLLVIIVVRYALLLLTVKNPDRRPELLLATSIFAGCVAGFYIGHNLALLQEWRRGRVAA